MDSMDGVQLMQELDSVYTLDVGVAGSLWDKKEKHGLLQKIRKTDLCFFRTGLNFLHKYNQKTLRQHTHLCCFFCCINNEVKKLTTK